MSLRPRLRQRERTARCDRRLESPLQLPSAPHRLRRSAPGLTPPRRRRQRHDQLQLAGDALARTGARDIALGEPTPDLLGPFQLHTQIRTQQVLQLAQQLGTAAHIDRVYIVTVADLGESTHGLSDRPFDGVQPISTISEVRSTNVLVGWYQVGDIASDQGTQRNLERKAVDDDIGAPGGRGVQVDPVMTGADGVFVQLGPLELTAHFAPDMSLGDREDRLDTSGFTDVDLSSQPIRGAQDVTAKS